MAEPAPTGLLPTRHQHPGHVLRTEFLEPLGISQYRLAQTMGVHPRRINQIVHGKRSISADTGLRLARAFGLVDTYWIDLQAHYDAALAREVIGGAALDEIEPVCSPPKWIDKRWWR
ncbi:HigA family addiction module antitoxin [Mycobacterium hubeiense]|uniref:HigA family addiction module antitoxin n=1 Tax=Mycobacterium hubeiense TaxID=1867256 RepID=UPI001E591445|nr:HigA family addiction module antitoxin [Mycobacterium sp. QGD 101]